MSKHFDPKKQQTNKPAIIFDGPQVPDTTINPVPPNIDLERSMPKTSSRLKKAGVTPAELILMLISLGLIITMVLIGRYGGAGH